VRHTRRVRTSLAAVLLAIATTLAPPIARPLASAPLASPSSTALPPETRRPATLAWEVVSRRPHDALAWTQGLQLDPEGRLFESTGLEGRSTLREVDPRSGRVLRSVALPDDRFAEGLALVDDRLIQLTWQDGVATAWDAGSFTPLEQFAYDGEGWGLCFDGRRLVMSDGSDRLTFRDAATFEPLGSVEVTLAGRPLAALNELECVDGAVWANVWLTDRIVRIDPEAGEVTGILDLPGILEAPTPEGQDPPDVLNGIAWDAHAGTFLVTGKLWPELLEIRVTDP
jgi:glutamine cyclotransferase